jgi:arabinose-5-phosphate isomerase
VHPGEAFHGDLGMIRPMDVVLMISNSGETEELVRLLPFMEHQKNQVIALTGRADSTLGRHADVVLDVSVAREACKNNLAPTSSTTATLVMGDALAVALSTLRGFQPEDFARFHPGGSLGRRLLTRVCDVMHRHNLPLCPPELGFRDIVHLITRGRLGLALVVEDGALRGVITDGDIRRAFDRHDNPMALRARDMMTPNPAVIGPQERFAAAEERMRERKINSLIVTEGDGRIVGVLQIYDIADEKAVG